MVFRLEDKLIGPVNLVCGHVLERFANSRLRCIRITKLENCILEITAGVLRFVA